MLSRGKKINYMKHSLICAAIGVILFVSQLLTYIFVEMGIDQALEDYYTVNMANTPSCSDKAKSILKFNEKSIVISGLAQLAIGGYFGILI